MHEPTEPLHPNQTPERTPEGVVTSDWMFSADAGEVKTDEKKIADLNA
jgi:hypothetical protein